MPELAAIFVFLVISYLIYTKIAIKFNITDKPNLRSSHERPVIRGGGIIFLVAVLISAILGYVNFWIAIAILVAGIVSIVDDIYSISQVPRLAIHTLSILIILWQTGIFGYPLVVIAIVVILFLAWVNVFNFMDGINGILVLYALTALGSFYFLDELFLYRDFILVMTLALLVFAFYNVRKKAKVFAGDVGSISMAVVIGFLMLELIIRSGHWEYLLFLSVFGIDAGFTILNRLKKRENIFIAHRSHLYQYLANEAGWPQLFVSFLYAAIQVLINLLVIWSIQSGSSGTLKAVILLVVLSVIYLVLRLRISRKYVTNN